MRIVVPPGVCAEAGQNRLASRARKRRNLGERIGNHTTQHRNGYRAATVP